LLDFWVVLGRNLLNFEKLFFKHLKAPCEKELPEIMYECYDRRIIEETIVVTEEKLNKNTAC